MKYKTNGIPCRYLHKHPQLFIKELNHCCRIRKRFFIIWYIFFQKHWKINRAIILKEKKSNSVIHSRRRSKVVNKHMHTREKNGDNFRNLFIPLQQYIKPQSFKHFRYGSLFPYYSYYNLHPRNPDLQYISLNSFDDVSVFPQREVYLMPHTLVNHKTPGSSY